MNNVSFLSDSLNLIILTTTVELLSNIDGPLSSVTPATMESIQRALDICQKSSVLRYECAQAIDMSRQHQSSMQQLVNDALTQKIAETVTLGV